MCNKFTSLWYENCAPTNKSPQVQTCFILVGNWWIWGAPWKPNFETHPYFTLKTVKLCWLSIPFQSFHLFRSFSTNDWATGFAQFAPGQKSVCGQDSGSSGILYDMLVYFCSMMLLDLFSLKIHPMKLGVLKIINHHLFFTFLLRLR